MSSWKQVLKAASVSFLLVYALTACSLTPHKYDDSPQAVVEQRAKARQLGMISVRASVPSDEEARKLFGVPLHKRGIQAVWLSITNNSDKRARLAPNHFVT